MNNPGEMQSSENLSSENLFKPEGYKDSDLGKNYKNLKSLYLELQIECSSLKNQLEAFKNQQNIEKRHVIQALPLEEKLKIYHEIKVSLKGQKENNVFDDEPKIIREKFFIRTISNQCIFMNNYEQPLQMKRNIRKKYFNGKNQSDRNLNSEKPCEEGSDFYEKFYEELRKNGENFEWKMRSHPLRTEEKKEKSSKKSLSVEKLEEIKILPSQLETSKAKLFLITIGLIILFVGLLNILIHNKEQVY